MAAKPKPKTHEINSYDEKDAAATVLAAGLAISEPQARDLVDAILRDSAGNKDVKATLQRSLDDLRDLLAKIPVPATRRRMIRAATFRVTVRHSRVWRFLFSPPGSPMLAIARLIYSEEKLEKIFLPLVSDYRLEYESAARESRLKAALTRLAYWWRFLEACRLDKVYSLLQMLKTLRDLFF